MSSPRHKPAKLEAELTDADGFQVLPRRWVVERTLAWLNGNRRLAKNFEKSIASAECWFMLARSL